MSDKIRSLTAICLRNIKFTSEIVKRLPEDLHDEIRKLIPSVSAQLVLFGDCYKKWHGDTLEVSHWETLNKHGPTYIYHGKKLVKIEYYRFGRLIKTEEYIKVPSNNNLLMIKAVRRVEYCKCGRRKRKIIDCSDRIEKITYGHPYDHPYC